jgi:hypothetical protein
MEDGLNPARPAAGTKEIEQERTEGTEIQMTVYAHGWQSNTTDEK